MSIAAGLGMLWSIGSEAEESPAGAGGGIPIVPAPKSVNRGSGSLALGERIVAKNSELRPLAQILSDEVFLLTGRRMAVANKRPQPGDIVLELDRDQSGESYTVEVGDFAAVKGGTYTAVAWGSVSLLQSMATNDIRVVVPKINIQDAPSAGYRGLMVDVARQWHSVETLKQLIVLCRWYKIRQFQIHFTDDQSFTFPSTAYPKLATPGRHYTADQLRDLEVFARDRGVEILPELDMPGHASAMVGQMPELFANNPQEGSALCPGRESTYQAMNTLVGEMTDIFRTTPYFHIGADEVRMGSWEKCKDCQSYMARHHLERVGELYRHFIVRMNEIVKGHGKKMIVWEGFHKGEKPAIPRDVTVMVFESLYNIAPDLIEEGYPVINTSWQPLYVVNKRNWSPECIYGWNMFRWENWWKKSKAHSRPIVVAPTNLVRGAQMCAWEQPEQIEISSLRGRLPAMSERLWNPESGRGYPDFTARLESTDSSLAKLLAPWKK